MDRINSPLSYALEDCESALEVATARVERLMGAAFNNGERACQSLKVIVKQRGIDGAIRLLETGGVLGREWHFGPTRERFLLWGNTAQVREAVAELPNAIRDQEALAARLADLRQAHRTLLENADRGRLGVSTSEPGHTLTRKRPRE